MRSKLIGGGAALALAVTLSACDDLDRAIGIDKSGSNTTAAPTTTGNTLTPVAPGATPAKPAGGDAALAAEMQAAAAQLSGSLPIQVDQITRVVAIRAEGTEFVYDLTVSQALPPAQLDAARNIMQSTNQRNMCANPQVATFIRRGGSMNHRYVDSGGNRFETRVVSC